MSAVWCPECGRSRGVEDQFPESTYEPGGEMAFMVTVLDCGHTTESTAVRVGPAPGAPYAGPQQVVAASHHPRDLAAATAAMPPEDPWA